MTTMRASANDTDTFLTFSETLVREAAEAILPHFGEPDLEVECKADSSPVTIADRLAEARMRELIESRFPEHGIIGEEYGSIREESDYVWVIDPIDGTKSFISGVPLFTTLVALQYRGRPLTGAIYQPILKQLVLGDGKQTTLNGRVVRGRPARPLKDASLLTTDSKSPKLYQGGARWDALVDRARLYRSWGDAYGYLLLVGGFADIMTDPELEIWDLAALLPILEGAGMRGSAWDGGDPLEKRSLIAARPELHKEALSALYPAGA